MYLGQGVAGNRYSLLVIYIIPYLITIDEGGWLLRLTDRSSSAQALSRGTYLHYYH